MNTAPIKRHQLTRSQNPYLPRPAPRPAGHPQQLKRTLTRDPELPPHRRSIRVEGIKDGSSPADNAMFAFVGLLVVAVILDLQAALLGLNAAETFLIAVADGLVAWWILLRVQRAGEHS